MATYDEIYGKRVEVLSSDPTLVSTDAGKVWYNSTSGTLKGVVAAEAWSSASPLVTAIYYNCGAGDQTAALSFQGTAGPNPTTAIQTEEYNGSGWFVGGALPAARRAGMGAGTQTAALSAGGNSAPGAAQTSTDEYNGTAWTSANVLGTGRRYAAGCGTQTAAICVGGQNPGGTQINSTEEYDGTNWTAGTAWPKTIRQEVVLGTQTATLGAGGYSTVVEVEAYEYDGTNWTATGDMNIGRYVFQGFGTQTVGIVCGGEPQPTAANKTESYDGSTFSSSPANLGNPTAQAASGVASPGTAGIIFGDASGGTTGQTEEYNKSVVTTTAAAFSSKENIPNAVYGGGTGGTPTAAFLVGGYGTAPAPSANRAYYQLFDGTNWSEGPDLNTARVYLGAAGTQTSSLAFGGRVVSGTTYLDNSEEYGGSSWTAGPTLNTARQFGGACGTQTAALATCGNPAGTTNEEYDGSNWTSVTGYPTPAANELRTTGTQTAAYGVGGPPYSTVTASYNGSSWTAGPTMVVGIEEGNLSGTTSSAIHAGGAAGGSNYTASSQIYNSSVWSTGANLGTGRAALPSGPANSSVSGSLIFGGPKGSPSYIGNQLEEYSGETTAVTGKTLTTS